MLTRFDDNDNLLKTQYDRKNEGRRLASGLRCFGSEHWVTSGLAELLVLSLLILVRLLQKYRSRGNLRYLNNDFV
jgi:hypothetical protein